MALNHREIRRQYARNTFTRFERMAGWLLLASGAVLLIFDGLLEGFRAIASDARLPLPHKLAVLAVAIGLVVLLISVFREQLFFRSRERYKDVED